MLRDRMIYTGLRLFAAFLLGTSLILGQSQGLPDFQLTVAVTDSTGAVIPRANIVIERYTERMTAQTDRDGLAHLRIPLGHYRVRVSAAGFKTADFADFRVNDDSTLLKAVLEVGGVVNGWGDYELGMVQTVPSTLPWSIRDDTTPESKYPRIAKAQKYTSEGFTPVDCFAGQAKVRGKRVKRELYSVFLPDDNKKCCGTPVKSARTDEHGHFFVEPLREGEYFVQFQFKGVGQLASFAILESYESCSEAAYVEINFSAPSKAQIQESIWINDSGQECEGNEPQCFRK
ncbi:MAG: carboxypeptidase-like regulatory domain-containing protein [Terriglobales bacterium]